MRRFWSEEIESSICGVGPTNTFEKEILPSSFANLNSV
jgi:hypothetical protein